MNINEYYLCIDLGGTKLFACLLNARGVIVRDVTITNHGTTQEDTFSLLCKTIDSLLAYAFEKDFSLAVWASAYRALPILIPVLLSMPRHSIGKIFLSNNVLPNDILCRFASKTM